MDAGQYGQSGPGGFQQPYRGGGPPGHPWQGYSEGYSAGSYEQGWMPSMEFGVPGGTASSYGQDPSLGPQQQWPRSHYPAPPPPPPSTIPQGIFPPPGSLPPGPVLEQSPAHSGPMGPPGVGSEDDMEFSRPTSATAPLPALPAGPVLPAGGPEPPPVVFPPSPPNPSQPVASHPNLKSPQSGRTVVSFSLGAKKASGSGKGIRAAALGKHFDQPEVSSVAGGAGESPLKKGQAKAAAVPVAEVKPKGYVPAQQS